MFADLEKILDNTPVLLARCSRDLRYRYVSKAYAEMIGRSPGELAGKAIPEIMGPKAFETIRPHVDTVLRGHRVEYDAAVDITDVGQRNVHVTYTPERDEQNEVVGWTAFITDTTEHKADAEEHKRDVEENEGLIRQVTHLERVVVLGGLSSGIAHELAQPLTACLANAQSTQRLLAAKKIEMEEVVEIIDEIIENISRAAQVIQRLRRLFTNRNRESALIDLNDKVQSTLGLLHFDIGDRKIRLEKDLKTDLPLVSGDPVQLQQVFINLMKNAIEAMAPVPPARRVLRIGTRTTNEGSVEVAISDCGPGMSPEQLEHIFEPFFTTKEQGLGLGLSISSRIVTSHLGKLTLSNGSGGGVTAVVSLPSATQVAAASSEDIVDENSSANTLTLSRSSVVSQFES